MNIETIKAFFLNNGSTIGVILSCLVILFCVVMIILSITSSETVTKEELDLMPEEKSTKIREMVKETRYTEKTIGKSNQDLDRYGRWKLTHKNGSEITRMGMLRNVLTSEYNTYREIK